MSEEESRAVANFFRRFVLTQSFGTSPREPIFFRSSLLNVEQKTQQSCILITDPRYERNVTTRRLCDFHFEICETRCRQGRSPQVRPEIFSLNRFSFSLFPLDLIRHKPLNIIRD